MRVIKLSVFSVVLSVLLCMGCNGASATLDLSAGQSAEESDRVFDAVVDAAGTGDYVTLQEAIDAMPDNRAHPWKVFIKNGVYEEWITVPESKRFLHLIGQDRNKVIICYKIHCGGEKDIYWEYSANNPVNRGGKVYGTVCMVEAPDFYAENISFVNSYGVEYQSGPQALALRTNNDRVALVNCSLRGFQDTWRTSTTRMTDRHYVTDSWIEGAVDYIYGAGNVLVENSTLYNVRSGSVIVAPSHKPGTKYGYVFLNCTVDGNEQARDGGQLLGRPWHNSPMAVYINTRMQIDVAPEGWTDMGTVPALFAEYNSMDREGLPVDVSQRKSEYTVHTQNGSYTGSCRTGISREEATAFTYESVVYGTDNWDPRTYAAKLPAPTGVKWTGHTLSWNPVKGAIGYVIMKNDQVMSCSRQTSFTDDILPEDTDQYRIYPVNEYGSLGHSVQKI